MHKSDIVSGGIFIAVAAVFMVGAVQLGIRSPTSDGVPGPGFFPFILGALVVVSAAALMINSIRHRGDKVASFRLDAEQRDNLKPLFHTLAGMAAFFAIWKLVSFEIAASAFCLYVNWIYKRSWRFNIIFTVVLVGFIHLVFTRLLFIQFEI